MYQLSATVVCGALVAFRHGTPSPLSHLRVPWLMVHRCCRHRYPVCSMYPRLVTRCSVLVQWLPPIRIFLHTFWKIYPFLPNCSRFTQKSPKITEITENHRNIDHRQLTVVHALLAAFRHWTLSHLPHLRVPWLMVHRCCRHRCPVCSMYLVKI